MSLDCNSHGWIGQLGCLTCAARGYPAQGSVGEVFGNITIHSDTEQKIAQLRAEVESLRKEIEEMKAK